MTDKALSSRKRFGRNAELAKLGAAVGNDAFACGEGARGE